MPKTAEERKIAKAAADKKYRAKKPQDRTGRVRQDLRPLSAKHERRLRIIHAMIRLGDMCTLCGERDRNVLQFDHIDPMRKEFELCRQTNMSSGRYLTEVDKCQLLCANCHTLRSKWQTHRRAGTQFHDLNTYLLPPR